jgi:hypothetical protein
MLVLTTGIDEPSLSLVDGIEWEVAMAIYREYSRKLRSYRVEGRQLGKWDMDRLKYPIT